LFVPDALAVLVYLPEFYMLEALVKGIGGKRVAVEFLTVEERRHWK
jgi:hypothetical protein